MAQIAIIGTPGAGKTVFLSVLAMRYRNPSPGQPWLEYKNRDTQRYVTEAWDTLQNQEWPPSTPPGRFPSLEWCLHTSKGEQHSILVRDPAGQDVKAIYDAPLELLTEDQRELKRVFDAADILLFLINLRPAMDAAGNQAKIDDIEIPIKLAIQDSLRSKRRVAVIVTQQDVIADRLQHLGVQQSLESREAISHFLPQVGGLLQAHANSIGTMFVASVADTVPIIENGKAYRRPQNDFSSSGLDGILSWIEEQMPDVATEHAHKEESKRMQMLEEQARAERARRESQSLTLQPVFRRRVAFSLAALVVTCLTFHFIRTAQFEKLHKSYYEEAVVMKQVPVEEERYVSSLPYTQYSIEDEIDFTRDSNLRDITFTNKSGKELYSVTIHFAWNTSFWGTSKSKSMTVATIGDGGSATARSCIYCDDVEWRNMRWQVSAYYRETVQRTQWVHDHTKDDQIRAKASKEAMQVGLAGSGAGMIPLLVFAVGAIRVRSRINNILVNGVA